MRKKDKKDQKWKGTKKVISNIIFGTLKPSVLTNKKCDPSHISKYFLKEKDLKKIWVNLNIDAAFLLLIISFQKLSVMFFKFLAVIIK